MITTFCTLDQEQYVKLTYDILMLQQKPQIFVE